MVCVQAFYFPAIPLVRDSHFALVSLSPLFRLYSFKIRKKITPFLQASPGAGILLQSVIESNKMYLNSKPTYLVVVQFYMVWLLRRGCLCLGVSRLA